ncbi:MAG: chemotaxis protein CheC [Cyclobacteriaceae bacterium]|nr:chemotaxis protein CheC [Cyclobacteriaceae bacterium]
MEKILTPLELDLITEIVNIGTGKASSSLSEVLNSKIDLRVPIVKIDKYEDIKRSVEVRKITYDKIILKFDGGIQGASGLVFMKPTSEKLVKVLMDTDASSDNFEEMKKEIISEMGNLILNGVVGSISNILETKVHYEVPYYYESGRIIDTSLVSDDSSLIMLCIATMRVKSYSFEFDLILVFNDSSFTKLNDYLKLKLKDIE